MYILVYETKKFWLRKIVGFGGDFPEKQTYVKQIIF
jgi:hypothetical protein